MKSLIYKLKINYYQKLVLKTLSNEHRLLYNHLLNFVKKTKACDFNILNQEYKKFKKDNNLTIQSKVAQNTCRKLINSIKSFYSLRKKDSNAKFPHIDLNLGNILQRWNLIGIKVVADLR